MLNAYIYFIMPSEWWPNYKIILEWNECLALDVFKQERNDTRIQMIYFILAEEPGVARGNFFKFEKKISIF